MVCRPRGVIRIKFVAALPVYYQQCGTHKIGMLSKGACCNTATVVMIFPRAGEIGLWAMAALLFVAIQVIVQTLDNLM